MSRRYTEQVEVHLGEPLAGRLRASAQRTGPGDLAAVPTAFVWRGRLHVVQAVLDHWTQRLPWWRPAWADGPGQDGAALEQDVWRVEASTGRLMGSGVYDLASGEQWHLVRVAD